ncbi:hydrogenase/urease maturation nickel metallochaperone HypA [Gemmatimonas sp.]
MHELSLANEICNIVEREVQRERGVGALRCVTLVAVEVGDAANVEPNSLQFCLDALLSTHPFGRGRSTLEMVVGDDLRVSWFEIDDEPPPPAPVDGTSTYVLEVVS